MTATEIMRQAEGLPTGEKLQVIRHWLDDLNGGNPAQHKAVERLLRRLENPDIPEDVWRGMEDAKDGRLVDMDTALSGKPPWVA